MRKLAATTLLLIATPAMAGTYVHVAPVVHIAPVMHVAPVVRVNPVVRLNPVVRSAPITGQPVLHAHHPRPQPVVVYSVPQKPKCAAATPGSKECAKK